MTVNLRARLKERSLVHSFVPEGFGKNVTGGAGTPQNTYVVTSPYGVTAGTFSRIIRDHNHDAIITFDPDLPYFCPISGENIGYNVTIDGFANGRNGIEMRAIQPAPDVNNGYTELIPRGSPTGGNVLVRGINFVGKHITGYGNDSTDLMALYTPAGNFNGLLVDRCTFSGASDGCLDLTGTSLYHFTNVTVQYCLFTHGAKTMLIKYNFNSNISLHHNIYMVCGERNPQVRGGQTSVDYVNNIILNNIANPAFPLNYVETQDYSDGSYTNPATVGPSGITVYNSTNPDSTAPGNVEINIRGNVFLGDRATTRIVTQIGGSTAGVYWDPHGTGVDNNYWNGCIVRDIRSDYYLGTDGDYHDRTLTDVPWVGGSPRIAPIDIPAEFQIQRTPITGLKNLIPYIGCPLRLYNDSVYLNALTQVMP